MKCPRCLAVCMDTDPFCFSCRSPFSRKQDNVLPGAEGGKPPYAARLSMIFMCVGACLGPVVGKEYGFISSSGGGGIDFGSAMWAGIGAAITGTLGYAIGMMLFGSGSRK